MGDLAFEIEPLLVTDRLLKPIPGNCPSGILLRNTAVYDHLRHSLRVKDNAPGGVWQRDVEQTDFRALIKTASDLLAAESKDLDIAVWLTEALAREHRLSGLAEGILLIQQLLELFWDTVYPVIDSDGDEGFRAKPINRLNTAFVAVLPQLPVTFDGRKLYEYNASSEVPSQAQADSNSEIRKKRERALADGIIAPEEINRSVEATSGQFYEEMSDEVRRVKEAIQALQSTCDQKFTPAGRPYLEKFSGQVEKLDLTLQALNKAKGIKAPVVKPGTPPLPPPESAPPSVRAEMAVKELEPVAVIPPAAAVPEPEPLTVLTLAAALRAEDPSNPVPYMLARSWCFGPMLAAGAVDESSLEPPSTELRTALRRAALNGDWAEVLDRTEDAMESPASRCWLDLHHHANRACRMLGYEAAAAGIQGMTATCLRTLPELMHAVMLDGSSTAGPETLVWIQTEVSPDPASERAASLSEVRPIDDVSAALDAEPDAFEVAENELNSGRFSEAFRVLAQALAGERSGRGRIQRKVQLAKICMEADRYRIALPLLEEVYGVIESRALASWEAPEFLAPPLAMLYRCLGKINAGATERRQQIYEVLCSVDPLKALTLTDLP